MKVVSLCKFCTLLQARNVLATTASFIVFSFNLSTNVKPYTFQIYHINIIILLFRGTVQLPITRRKVR